MKLKIHLHFNFLILSNAEYTLCDGLELKHIEIPDSRSGYESVNIFSSLVT